MFNKIIDILFPKFCVGCGREGSYLCRDCKSLIAISEYQYCLCKKPQKIAHNSTRAKCNRCSSKKLNGLYFATSYQQDLVQTIIKRFKYQPSIRELAKPLTDLIITHFLLLNNSSQIWENKILIPVPSHLARVRRRGFNPAQEIAKELSKKLEITCLNKALIKTKKTAPQVELSKPERIENLTGAFEIHNQSLIKDKKILLVDDVYTTGSTMEECAKVLKEAGAKQLWGVAVARE